jgi:cellobiose-specific phosphotransferase system component IIA
MLKNEKNTQKQPIKYWLVEITLTSGDMLQFYAAAINQIEAYKKADEYAEIAEGNEKLMKFYKGFKKLP